MKTTMKTIISLCLVGILGVICAWAQDAKLVKIGVLEDMSGVYADITGPGSVAAAELAIADFGPTVLGRKIELVSADHQNKADAGAGVARRWIDVENIDLITGIGNSSVALAVRNLTREAKKIDIVTSAGVNDLTGKACSPTGFHWVYNTYSLSKTVASASVRAGGDTLYFVAADYAFGAALARDGARFAEEAGGKVLGTVRAPLNSADFSSFILQAQSSKAKNITLALAGNDLVNFVRQASEFNVVQQGQSLSAMIMFVNDIHAIGLKVAQGLYLAETFYWDLNDDTRAFAKRFFEKRRAMPNGMQAGVYSAVKHYLTAVKAAGTTDSAAVAAKIREIPVNDFFSENVRVREDGRAMRNMHLFQVKKPDASKSDWDLLTRVDTLKDGAAFEPLSEGGCPLVAGAK
jgi:branched-chain amino acid transport system substrate-binding protein